MTVRRKSDQVRTVTDCKYHRSFMHERDNQLIHEQRMADPNHEQYSPCWCCCVDCKDLTWYHEEPPSLLKPTGELHPAWQPDVPLPPGRRPSPS
jgi:hypothetical protein